MSGLLTAGAGQHWESELVARLDEPNAPLTVVRRCADMNEVLAIGATGRARAAVLDGSIRRLDTEAVQRLLAAGVAVVGVHPAGDTRGRTRLERLGITALVADDEGAPALMEASRRAIAELADRPVAPGAAADPRRALPPPARPVTPAADPVRSTGIVVAVWGPTGAPGRSTVAAGLADMLSGQGHPTLLIDADVYGGVLASAFGVLDESPGLAGACRLAANGRLDAAGLAGLCWSLSPQLRLLTGIARADRWPEVRPTALGGVLAAARRLAPVTIVDCGFAIEADEEISFDTLAPRRNGATLTVLDDADRVLVVGSADPPGMERLIRALAELAEILPSVRPEVVLNRVRSSSAPADQARAALRRFAGITSAVELPEDRAGTDAAWIRGVPLSVAAPKSPLRAALRPLSGSLLAASRAPAGVASR